MRRRAESAPASRGAGPFPEVEIPEEVLERARALRDFDGVDLIEEFLRSVHGPMPDHRDDRTRWLAWVEAVEGRALSFLEDGLLAERPPF